MSLMRLRQITIVYAVCAICWHVVQAQSLNQSTVDLPASEVQQGFSEYYDLIYQIQVISPKAGSKSSFGSGFQVTADGLIVTNYHVVSDFVQNPSINTIEYRSHLGMSGALELLDFDIVNDLAVLRRADPSPRYFDLSDRQLPKGERVFALGNPRDYGVTMVQGPSNGQVEHSYNPQILFSGSLNPGMSGGPALDSVGKVVGINVATAGSQLSFLIPAGNAIELVAANRTIAADDYQSEISRQIKAWQRPRVQGLIDKPWKAVSFDGEQLFGEIRHDFQCWGSSNEDEENRVTERVKMRCSAGNRVYISRDYNAGHLYFSFSKSRSLALTPMQFTRTLSPRMSANNRSRFEYSSSYQCHVDFLEGDNADETYTRATLCIRAFKKLPGLFDSLLNIEKISAMESSSRHLSLSALERDQIEALNQKFMEKTR